MENTSKSFNLIWGAGAIADELGCDRRRAFYLLEKGEIPAKKVGGKWVVRRDELHAFFLKGDAA
ncbi:excisionase family DNA binding protein [Pseudaminobacter salicylatoxidans]|uniref:Excisionase family DNA binding protein n=1 Tax=Pseudaminobacter salicylatoxidans TaxID=93369 RepID=A0A316BYQ3_PSESE|nr:helix-turn-helix domain-containing protein [Pseudaminobacter salicylatoxidans]PWJ79793.1 excisionase family DNA binding protein [Pseudaminobacter salicylatoxidans]